MIFRRCITNKHKNSYLYDIWIIFNQPITRLKCLRTTSKRRKPWKHFTRLAWIQVVKGRSLAKKTSWCTVCLSKSVRTTDCDTIYNIYPSVHNQLSERFSRDGLYLISVQRWNHMFGFFCRNVFNIIDSCRH